METIAERVIHLVKLKGGNMSEFARKIEVTPAYISKLKNEPSRVPSDLVIERICREYAVDRTWLETGVGEPFRESSPEEEIQKALVQALGGSDESKARLIRAVANLPDELAEKAVEIVLKLADDLKAE